MVFGFGKKYCEVCGVEVDKNASEVRFGKHFCSEEHAEEFVAEVKQAQKRAARATRSGGCC